MTFSGAPPALRTRKRLATGDDVEAGARLGKNFQYGHVCCGFHRVADLVGDGVEGFFCRPWNLSRMVARE